MFAAAHAAHHTVGKHQAPVGALRLDRADLESRIQRRKAPSTRRCIETSNNNVNVSHVPGRKAPSTKRCIEAGVVAPMRHRLSLGEDLAPESYACRRDPPGKNQTKNQTSSGIRRTVGGVIIQNRPDHRSVLRLRSRRNESAPSHPETSPQLTA